MSHERKAWIVAYDIADPRRLKQVHRVIRKLGVAMQYSAFSVQLNDREIDALLVSLGEIIDRRVDDVRAYHVPAHCKVWMLGGTVLPDGVIMSAEGAAGALMDRPALAPIREDESDFSFGRS